MKKLLGLALTGTAIATAMTGCGSKLDSKYEAAALAIQATYGLEDSKYCSAFEIEDDVNHCETLNATFTPVLEAGDMEIKVSDFKAEVNEDVVTLSFELYFNMDGIDAIEETVTAELKEVDSEWKIAKLNEADLPI